MNGVKWGGQGGVQQDNLPIGEELLDSTELMAGLHGAS